MQQDCTIEVSSSLHRDCILHDFLRISINDSEGGRQMRPVSCKSITMADAAFCARAKTFWGEVTLHSSSSFYKNKRNLAVCR